MTKNPIKTKPLLAPVASDWDERVQRYAEAAWTLLSPLPAVQRGAIIRQLAKLDNEQKLPFAEAVQSVVFKLADDEPAKRKEGVHVAAVHEEITKRGFEATPKAVYSALAYLARKGHVKQVAYGRYIVGGALLVDPSAPFNS